MKLTFECDCGNKVETKVTYESDFGAVAIRFEDKNFFEDETFFNADDSGYVYVNCGKCGKQAEVSG